MTIQEQKTRTIVPEFLSRKIKTLNFFTIVFVVFIHSYNYLDSFLQPTTKISEGFHIPAMIEFFISNALTRFANPLFFAISGYLFFAGVQCFNAQLYISKVKKRVLSLLTPYAFWVFLWSFIGIMILNIFGGEHFPLLTEKFASWSESPFFSMYNSPLPFQFWFIKDLFKLVLLSPVIYFLVKKLGGYAIVLFLVPWLMDITFPHMPNCDGVIAFTIGCHIALNGFDKKYMTKPIASFKFAVFPVIWIILCTVYTIASATGQETGIHDFVLLFLYKGCVAFGLISVYVIYDLLHRKKSAVSGKLLNSVKDSSFIIFCIHEPLQHFVFQAFATPDTSDAIHMLLYFGLPLLFVLLGVITNSVLKKASTSLHKFLTGSR